MRPCHLPFVKNYRRGTGTINYRGHYTEDGMQAIFEKALFAFTNVDLVNDYGIPHLNNISG